MSLSFDNKQNFAYSVVAVAPSPATSGTSLQVAPGDGAKFPAVPFNVVVWPTGVQPTTTNAEVLRVTAISTDTLTVTRAQEGTSARSIVANDQISLNITAKTLTDIEDAFVTAGAITAPIGGAIMWFTSTAPTGWLLLDGSAVSRSTYSELFALWGTTYGAGDGSTTFNVPDMRQRIPIGKTAAGTLSTLGTTTGSWDHTHGPGTLTVASHTHGPGTLTVASHTHDSGTLSVASHTHGAGTFAVSSHTHSVSLDTSFTDISHTHSTPNHTHTFTTGGPSDLDDVTSGSDTQPAHALHTHSGTTDSGGGSTTGSGGGSHRHAVTGDTGSATPGLSGTSASTAPSVNSGNTGASSPLVGSGATAGTAPAVSTGVTGTANPPVLVVNFICRALSSL